MILGTLIYALFAAMATIGAYLGVARLRGPRWAVASAALSLLFFFVLYAALEALVLSELRTL